MAIPASQAASTIAQSSLFNLRCQLIALQYAVNVVLTEGAVADHANRLAFANKVITGAISPILLAQVVLTDATIQATAVGDLANMGAAVADTGPSSIDGRLQAMWNALADSGI